MFLLDAIVTMLFTARAICCLFEDSTRLNKELNVTAFGYLALLFVVIASVAIGLKLVYERKHETSDKEG